MVSPLREEDVEHLLGAAQALAFPSGLTAHRSDRMGASRLPVQGVNDLAAG